jgi:protein tyrosine/serine phosphatase
MNRRTSVVTALFIALSFTTLSLAQNQLKYDELPNLHQVNSNLYRGGQPKEGGIGRLKQLGVKTIINLRDDDGRARSEEAEARAAGLRYFNVPLPNFNRPTDKTVSQILALISSNENQPVFVHCKRGSDRTGTIIAVYRIEHDGWTGEKAKSEAKHYGLGFWQRGMKDYIHDYYRRFNQSKVGVAPVQEQVSKPPHL